MNMIQIAGHLGADVEPRFTPDGQKVTTLSVATSVRRSGKDETIWWRVTLWGDRFDKFLSHLKKGSAIIVVGEFMRAEVYTDRQGKQQVSLEIRAEFLRFSPFGRTDKGGAQEHSQAASYSNNYGQETKQSQPQPQPQMARGGHNYEEEDFADTKMSTHDLPF